MSGTVVGTAKMSIHLWMRMSLVGWQIVTKCARAASGNLRHRMAFGAYDLARVEVGYM